MEKRKRRPYHLLLYTGILVLFLIAVIIRWDEAVKISRVLARCAPGPLTLAILAQFAYYLAQTGLYWTICRSVGLPYRYHQLLPLIVLWPFMNVVAPSTSVSAIALLADDARRRGMPPARAVVAAVTHIAFCYASLSLAVCVALVELARQGLLAPYQRAAAVVLGLGLAGLLAVLAFAGWAPRLLTRLLDGLLQILRRLRRALHLRVRGKEGTAAATVEHLHQSVREVIGNRPRLGLAALWALLGQGCSLVVLYLVMRALGQKVGNAVILAGYSITSTVTNVSPTPQGVGFSEGTMVTLLRSLGQPRDGAWAVTLAYRGVTFWLPLLAGFVLARTLPTFRGRVAWRRSGAGPSPLEAPCGNPKPLPEALPGNPELPGGASYGSPDPPTEAPPGSPGSAAE